MRYERNVFRQAQCGGRGHPCFSEPPLRVKRETLEVIPPIARVPNERESDLEAAYVIRLQLQWSCSRSSFTRGYSRLKKGFRRSAFQHY